MRNLFSGLMILICIGIAQRTHAQVPQAVQDQIKKLMPNPIPQSPDVGSIEKFGTYAVTAFNGLPDISIPIYEPKSGGLKAPITLRYHAGGIKRTDHAGWVGAGWSLQAGGQISRKVNGKPDEADFYTANTEPLQPSIEICSDPNDVPYLRQVAWGNLDTQPDVFSYSFPGKGGNFLLSSQGIQSPYLVPYEPILVDVVNFDNFRITDENGILYQYGGVVNGSEGSNTSAGSNQSGGTTAWHLTQMMDTNSNDKIVFEYQPLGVVAYSDVNDIVQVSDLCISDGTQGNCPPAQAVGSNVSVDMTTNPKGLQRIEFDNGQIEFILNTAFRNDEIAARSLDSINVYSLLNGIKERIKTYKFKYSYFRNSANTADLMLRLDSIRVVGKTGVTEQQYKFTYFTDHLSWTNNIRARDYWGFYNGADNADLIVPQQITIQALLDNPTNTFTTTIGTANREANVEYLTEGALKRIDFPTGGYSEFEYEVNKYREDNVNYTASGLRVSKITSSDGGDSPPVIKVYKYGSDEAGYGVKNFVTNQFLYNSEAQMITTCCLSGGCPGDPGPGTLKYRSRTWFSNSAYNIDGYDNAPVVYLYVAEYLVDLAGNNIGKTVYEYDNGSFVGTGVNLYVPFSTNYFRDSFAWKNGRLTKKMVYDKYGNKLQQTENTYGMYATQSKFVGYAANFYNTYTLNLPCGNTCDPLEVQYAYLSQSTGAIRQTGTLEYTYKSGDLAQFVLKQTNSVYDPLKLQIVETKVKKSSSSEEYVTANNYAFQFTTNAASTGAAKGIYLLNQKNVLTKPIESYTYVQSDNGSNQRIVSGQLTTFKENNSNFTEVVADKIYLWESSSPVPRTSYSPMAINGSNSGVTMDSKFVERINLIAYDNTGNILTAAKSNDVVSSYLYGTNNTLPKAEIRNASNTYFSRIDQTNSITAVTLNGPTPSVVGTSTFTVPYAGTVYLKLGVSGNPSYSTIASYTGITSGSVTLGHNACGVTTITFPNVSPGTYTLTITLTTPDSGVSFLGACGQVEYPGYVTVTSGFNESYYENFEDIPDGNGVSSGAAESHTGNKYFEGNFSVLFAPPNGRTYIVEYWYFDDNTSKWIYKSANYTGPTTLSDGVRIDNVRVYPKDAQMKSYTYDPLFGMTSSISESGLVYKYEYDSFGRLTAIRDGKGNIEKHYTYHYQGN
jgi:YD repeat-containing protein